MELIITVCVALIGGYAGVKMKIPAGPLIGAMIATALFNIICGMAYMPPNLKLLTQIATGAYIGAKISKADVISLRKILKPTAILAGVLLVITISIGLLIWRISRLTVATALFSMAPAGIADMTLASMDFDADPSVVALIHTLRVIFTVCLIPMITKWVDRNCPREHVRRLPSRKSVVPREKTWKAVVCTLLVAVLSGTAGKLLGVPGGAIAFSMAGCAAYNIVWGKGYMPLRLRQFIQVFAGALIGCTVGREQVAQIVELYPIIILAIVSFIVLDLVAALLIAKWTDMDMVSALFACAPGGVTDIVLIAEDMGVDSVKIAGMHMIRLVGVIALYPTIISGIVTWLD